MVRISSSMGLSGRKSRGSRSGGRVGTAPPDRVYTQFEYSRQRDARKGCLHAAARFCRASFALAKKGEHRGADLLGQRVVVGLHLVRPPVLAENSLACRRGTEEQRELDRHFRRRVPDLATMRER